MKELREIFGLNLLSKTLRFELNPIEKMLEGNEAERLIEQDEQTR